jgi:hypothetical protein
MKTGIALFFVALASCVVPIESPDFATKEAIRHKYKQIDQANTTTATGKEIYPQLSNPCKQDYSSLSSEHEYLTKLDCVLEKQNG